MVSEDEKPQIKEGQTTQCQWPKEKGRRVIFKTLHKNDGATRTPIKTAVNSDAPEV